MQVLEGLLLQSRRYKETIHNFGVEESRFWTYLPAVQILNQLETSGASWKEKYDKGDRGLLSS